ncbi:MAG: hypothetical protein QXU40_00480 [Candidatus Pacearchaeota archaeon]
MAQAKPKKIFFDVEIPIIKKETQLYDYNLSKLNNRFISYDLTRILKGKNVILKLKVKVDNNKAVADPIEIFLVPSFLRRMIRRGVNYIEDSFSCESKDAILRIKPYLLTRRKVSRGVRKALREKTKEELINYVKMKNTDAIFSDIISGKIQKFLSLKLKKIYPLSFCEIRVLKIEKGKT